MANFSGANVCDAVEIETYQPDVFSFGIASNDSKVSHYITQTTNIDHTGTGGDYKQGVFHRDALAMAMMQDLKIETQRDASLRADEIVATAVYGVGELNDTYGVEVHSDSSIQ